MRIRKLYLKDIGPFDEVEFEFKPQEKGKAEIHILTGPNGSGKTTVLQAMASVFSPDGAQTNAFDKRFRYPNSNDPETYKGQVEVFFDEDDGNAGIRRVEPKSLDTFLGFETFGEAEAYVQFYRNLIKSPASKYTTPYVVIAYSGYRYTKAVSIDAIREPKANPLATALEFIKEDRQEGFTINQWIANSISTRALEKEKKNDRNAEKAAAALASLEKVISEVIGSPIKFEVATNPLEIKIIINGAELDFDVLPDGLRSLISWVGDLLKRLSSLTLKGETPVNEQNIILFLDEIEVHLHPAWQRKVLPAVQKFLPNAQIFLTTHSPFVVNSVDGAWVYDLGLKDGKAFLEKTRLSKTGESYEYILRDIFDIETRFGGETQKDLDLFQQLKKELLKGKTIEEEDFLKLAHRLATQSLELQSIVQFELRQLNRIKGKSYEI